MTNLFNLLTRIGDGLRYVFSGPCQPWGRRWIRLSQPVGRSVYQHAVAAVCLGRPGDQWAWLVQPQAMASQFIGDARPRVIAVISLPVFPIRLE